MSASIERRVLKKHYVVVFNYNLGLRTGGHSQRYQDARKYLLHCHNSISRAGDVGDFAQQKKHVPLQFGLRPKKCDVLFGWRSPSVNLT